MERLVRPVSAAHRMTKPLRHTTILLAALVAAFAAAVATPAAQAAPAALEQTTDTCWLDVINDWLDNSQVDKTYAIPCYTQAIQHLNEYPDVRATRARSTTSSARSSPPSTRSGTTAAR